MILVIDRDHSTVFNWKMGWSREPITIALLMSGALADGWKARLSWPCQPEHLHPAWGVSAIGVLFFFFKVLNSLT